MSVVGVDLPRMLVKYREEIIPTMRKEFSYPSVMAIPKLDRIVVSMGVKEGAVDIKALDQASLELGKITGQKPKVCRAKKSIAQFKLREGSPIGLKVTLRHHRMFEFFDRLVTVAIPRIRDFRGISPKSFDGAGNYSMGVTEQIIFPEIEYDKIPKITGMNITFVTSALTDDEAKRLLELFGMPFRKNRRD